MMKNMKMSVVLGIMFAGYLVNSNENCYAASLTCQEEVLNELCGKAPETSSCSDEKPRATCFENGKRLCKEKYFSGFPECFEGDGTNGYAVLSVDDRLISYRGAWDCDTTLSDTSKYKNKSPDWKGNNKWYRFGESGTGKLATKRISNSRVCGTNYGGYSVSLLPTACETRAITVCFDNNGECTESKLAFVTNCGSFFVYNLPDTKTCSRKYCSEL